MSTTANLFPVPPPLCFTRFEFADALRVSVRTVDRMIADGEIRVRRVRGKCVRILRSDVERYLDGGSATGNGNTKNLNTNNQTSAVAPETNKTKTK
jgi:excisionase family DNA binding protein